jgi:FKBP-type peptidyl-prolyl cis-trans isomerase
MFRCWDIAIQNLKAGSKAKVTCPPELAYGLSDQDSPLGGEPIPAGSDIEF